MFVQECRDQAQVDVWRPILCGMLEVGVQIGGYSCVEVRGNFRMVHVVVTEECARQDTVYSII